MKHIIMLLIAVALLLPVVAEAQLPTCYYTYEQISALLATYQQNHPDIAKVYTIGYSELDNLPIYAMKISDNVNLDEDEPALLFVGQVHAEEVLGVQITMSNIEELIALPSTSPWISQLELWFVPTLNPEGHNVVTSNMDISYRKNKRDNNFNNIFDYNPITGYDIDGVDINRNFTFNWAHGDSLLQPGGLEVWDYYRGPAPMSESETRALKQLCDQKKFIYSICWHSSRTGNFAEKVYYPFNWKEIRPSPDLSLAASIGNGVGSQIIKESGTGSYEVYPNLSRKGAFHDWMYQQYGTIALLVECGTRFIQPDSLLMQNTVQRCSNGVKWLLNRALTFSTAVPTSSMLVGKVVDAETNNPLEAEVIVLQHNAPWFEPRRTNPITGRYFRPLLSGGSGGTGYSVTARKKGYYDTVATGVTLQNSYWTTLNLTMQPIPAASLNAIVRTGSQPISARVIIGDVYPDTLQVVGNFVHNGYAGTYPIQIYAEGYFPYLGTITLEEGHNYTEYNLSSATTVFSENWENGLTNWQIEGPWVVQNELSASGFAITDS
ncbi:MAG: M14 family zinc carboxypeptidase, partial [Candidatus Cloacimonetes bacterium]|nr:M14 family zinc carboxypeptidase [Candidatus Cloacimonadota bacterium]